MSRILVTGSTGGLGLLSARTLLAKGHGVVFHARHEEAASKLRSEVPASTRIALGDLGTVAGALNVCEEASAGGPLDAVIHNAGVMCDERSPTPEGVPEVFAVNVLAPFILTAVLTTPLRHVYLSSSMHRVEPDIDDLDWTRRRWNGSQAYSESKLYVTALAFAVARLRPALFSNAVDPGWVPTRMGGKSAPDDLDKGCETQSVLASGDEPLGSLTGRYLHHMRVAHAADAASRLLFQERLLGVCERISGLRLAPLED